MREDLAIGRVFSAFLPLTNAVVTSSPEQ